jgi:hypothetical protein
VRLLAFQHNLDENPCRQTRRSITISPTGKVAFCSTQSITQRRLGTKVPELTLDRTVVLLEAALEEPEMRLARATALVQYYLIRNRVARQSHERTWWKKHEGVNFLLL